MIPWRTAATDAMRDLAFFIMIEVDEHAPPQLAATCDENLARPVSEDEARPHLAPQFDPAIA